MKNPFSNEYYTEMLSWLTDFSGRYFERNVWRICEMEELGIPIKKKVSWKMLDFSDFKSVVVKNEIKYFFLNSLKNGLITPEGILGNYKRAVVHLAKICNKQKCTSVMNVAFDKCNYVFPNETERRSFNQLYNRISSFFQDFYDRRSETDKDIWNVFNIKGAHLSAVDKRTQHVISLKKFPLYYREVIKEYLMMLVTTYSWSYTLENYTYLKKFFNFFYSSGYADGFLESLSRADIEKYYSWINNNFSEYNLTVKSRYISFIKRFIDYLQKTGHKNAPATDIDRLIICIDQKKRTKRELEMYKIKHIPEPILNKLDSCIHKIDPPEFLPVYLLLRETGWRGADILNLRYDNCLEHVWHKGKGEYVPFLCGEITKTGNNILRVPLRKELENMLGRLIDEAKEKSTPENNPNKYLFNTYFGKYIGLPYSKAQFVVAITKLIEKEDIRDYTGELYHFRVHSLRHTRAMEYIEQGMPVAIIKELLGHCSIDMTLRYAKITDAQMYSQWAETERLDIYNTSSCNSISSIAHSPIVEGKINSHDEIKVPLGVCQKNSKLPCKNQINRCLECRYMCVTSDDYDSIISEIRRVKQLIEQNNGKGEINQAKINENYLEKLQIIINRIQ